MLSYSRFWDVEIQTWFSQCTITLILSIRLIVMVHSLNCAINVPLLLFWRMGEHCV